MRLRFCVCTTFWLMSFAASQFVVPMYAEPHAQEKDEWVNPGVSVGAPAEPIQFVRDADAAFIGVLKNISVRFIDREEQALFTVLQFTVKEWVYSKQPNGRTSEIEVLTPGGTFGRVGGRRIPRRVAEIAEGLKVGHEYFVPLDYGDTPDTIWTDKYVLYSPDSISELSSTDVTAVHPHSRWVQGILERGDSAGTRPGQPPNRREQFLGMVRRAAAQEGLTRK